MVVTAKVIETLEKVYSKQVLPNTGGEPEWPAKHYHPIMPMGMYKNAWQAIILATMAMPPTTGHELLLNGLMSMKTM